MVPINTTQRNSQQVITGLAADSSSTRLAAALTIGTHPDPGFVDALIERCAVEPDFYVRDMLTWALTRHAPADTVPKLRAELESERAQARSQALHSLSKIGDRGVWPSITRDLLFDTEDEVARTAWRTAVALVPESAAAGLAADLATQLARGDRELRLSLSRSLAELGEVAEPVLRAAMTSPDPAVRAHAEATERLRLDPESGFYLAVDAAKRVAALGPEHEAAAC
ncbi:HEAT repeat domain-containing protein [Nocardia sp. NPDC127579]|uniref:HEAT repeat domain-containing protein n=1 Tax=Nocardia sp. NPDC127579 TaxID=3345402 RepID=UPI00362C5148